MMATVREQRLAKIRQHCKETSRFLYRRDVKDVLWLVDQLERSDVRERGQDGWVSVGNRLLKCDLCSNTLAEVRQENERLKDLIYKMTASPQKEKP